MDPLFVVKVALSGGRDYEVRIGHGLYFEADWYCQALDFKGRIFLITDETVSRLPFIKELESGFGVGDVFRVPAGESSKSMQNVEKALSFLAQRKASRFDVILAVGGGVVGDLAGFISAIYLRGIAFVQIPTTLLAMIDSSVGGKTGVNLPEGKNLVGAFNQPKLVLVDLSTLLSLPRREFAAGMAEVIKYGAIKDDALFDKVNRPVSTQDGDLAEIIERCVSIKARIVEQDEFETKGERALLNFGHTIGHAIERATGYNHYLHGEAISLGMRAAARLSVLMKTGLPEGDVARLVNAMTLNHLPTHFVEPEKINRELLSSALGNDKKVSADGQNRWVLLSKIGEAGSGYTVPIHLVDQVIEELYHPYVS